MIINQNLSALNTFNSLNKNTKATQSSIQKLSTGQRINGAADDAAGLAISEKMRGQISGLKQASSNAQDGISMLQTAEGGLDQTHSILQRMRELAVQSASDTNTADDRAKIQGEADQLAKEITRISNTTEFNTQNLLAGGLSDTFHIGANSNQNLSVSVTAMDAQSLGVAGSVTTAASVKGGEQTQLNLTSVASGVTAATGYKVSVKVTAATVKSAVTTISNQNTSNTSKLKLGDVKENYTGTTDTDYLVKVASVVPVNSADGKAAPVDAKDAKGAKGAKGAAGDAKTTANSAVESISYSKDHGTSWTTVQGDFSAGIKIDGVKVTMATSQGGNYTVGDEYSFSLKASRETLQLKDKAGTNIGASQDMHFGDSTATLGDALNNKTVSLQFTYGDVKDGTLSFNAKQATSSSANVTQGKVLTNANTVAALDMSTQSSANTAITTIDQAINTVSKQRSALGAYENRLTNTIDNLNTSNENITASESRIRDVDMASEMSNYQKNNILQSAATAMLAKANTQPQSVLQLLQG